MQGLVREVSLIEQGVSDQRPHVVLQRISFAAIEIQKTGRTRSAALYSNCDHYPDQATHPT
jgi:hypothetical protein